MQTNFKVIYKNREIGPLSETQIQKMVEAKQLLPTDRYFNEDRNDWLEISHWLDDQNRMPPPPVGAAQFEVFEPEDTSLSSVPIVFPKEKKVTEETPSSGGNFSFSGGVGTLNLKHLKSGKITLRIKSQSGLDLPSDIHLTVQSAPASQLRLECSQELRAGEDLTVSLKALDAFENLAGDFSGSIEIALIGHQTEIQQAQFNNGIAILTFKPTVAESLSLHVREPSHPSLVLPSPVEINVTHNVPVRLTVDAPQEVRAGEDIQLKVIALDAYGNVVSDFKDEIDLHIEAEPLSKAG